VVATAFNHSIAPDWPCFSKRLLMAGPVILVRSFWLIHGCRLTSFGALPGCLTKILKPSPSGAPAIPNQGEDKAQPARQCTQTKPCGFLLMRKPCATPGLFLFFQQPAIGSMTSLYNSLQFSCRSHITAFGFLAVSRHAWPYLLQGSLLRKVYN
jgi:hypothetical protein